MADVRWHVRVDASESPVIGVKAPDWYTARALAVMALHVEMHRLHVEQIGRATIEPCFRIGRLPALVQRSRNNSNKQR